MRDVTLYRIDASSNTWRFYRLDLQPDLFGLWLLVKKWGRIGNSGQSQVRSHGKAVSPMSFMSQEEVQYSRLSDWAKPSTGGRFVRQRSHEAS
jgi:predicted DNA-binding WGR domain protein